MGIVVMMINMPKTMMANIFSMVMVMVMALIVYSIWLRSTWYASTNVR